MADKSNEIPAAQTLIDRLDLDGKRVVLGALHPQELTAQKLLFERGADDVMTVEANQKSLSQTLETKRPEPFFPPRPTPTTQAYRREHNRSRREVRALNTMNVTPEEVGFAGAAPIGKLRTRGRGCRRKVQETRFLITSASNERLDAFGRLDAKRGYWAIESSLHYRLDEVLDEDESRVRGGRAAHLMGRCRRLVVGFACEWLRKAKGTKKNCRKGTHDFQDHLTANNRAHAFALITASTPSAWLQN